jgi:DNA-binding NarL/FixJ family response regulator
MAGRNFACGRILVVDDDDGMRQLVVATLRDGGFEPVGAASGEEALRLVADDQLRLAVLDVNLPGLSGYEVCRRIKEELRPGLPVIFLSGERTESFDRVAGLLIGADDYMVKPFAPDELVVRIRTVLRRAVVHVSARMSSLTRRELEVLRLLAHANNQAEIADQLVISRKTVGTHIEHILEKLSVSSRTQAVALAYRENIVGPTH